MTGRRSWWAAVLQWRNWPVLVKIAAVLVVPVVGAMVLGILRVQSDVALADSYAEVERLANLRAEMIPMIAGIQRERILAVQLPAIPQDHYRTQAVSVDNAVASLEERVRQQRDLGRAATAGFENMKKALGGLSELRQQVLAGADSTAVMSGYGTVTKATLDFDRSLGGRFPDEELTGASTALFDMQTAREQVALQHALVLISIRRGEMLVTERDVLIEADVRLADMISDTRAVAPARIWEQYLDRVAGPDVSQRQEFVRQARAAEPPQAQRGRVRPTMPFGAYEWNETSDTTTRFMTQVAIVAAHELQTAAKSLQDSTGNRAGAESVLLLALVLLAAAIGGVMGRYLLRSLGTLRKTALDVAAVRLPAAVASIRAGRAVAIEPVPVHTREEFGQLARAFDTVHSQAVRSAEEEANLRGNLRNIFVNLSRRSQSLVERQLKLMEQLEQKENDPDQLANLFKLDHLATRMRRNNENLVVLSGAELGRRFTEHVPVADVLRAAVSEVEYYQRAVVQSAPRVQVLGYAAGDLVRSIAELVENATAFSPPNTQVIIRAARRESGAVQIEVVDDGIGMADAELAAANAKVAAGGGVDVPVSRQMGLFVVGSLANRHGIEVRLARRRGEQGSGEQEGLVATVVVPAELVVDPQDSARRAQAAAGRGSVPVQGGPPRTPAGGWPVPASQGQPGPAPLRDSQGTDQERQGAAQEGQDAGWESQVPVAMDGPVDGSVDGPRTGELAVAGDTRSPGAPGVRGRLMSAGIFVSLPELPFASSPASILFQSDDPEPLPAPQPEAVPANEPANSFAWLSGGPATPSDNAVSVPAPQAQRTMTSPQKPGELPKRVPKAQLFAGSRDSGNGRRAAPQQSRGAAGAERARGFLSSFQAGVRQTKDPATGQKDELGEDQG